MTIEMEYNSAEKYLLATVSGVLTLDAIWVSMEQITTSEEYPSDLGTVWDIRNLEFESIDGQFERSVISIRKEMNDRRGNARLAFIVSDLVSFGMTRMYQTLSELADLSQEIEIFDNFDEGVKWVTA